MILRSIHVRKKKIKIIWHLGEYLRPKAFLTSFPTLTPFGFVCHDTTRMVMIFFELIKHFWDFMFFKIEVWLQKLSSNNWVNRELGKNIHELYASHSKMCRGIKLWMLVFTINENEAALSPSLPFFLFSLYKKIVLKCINDYMFLN